MFYTKPDLDLTSTAEAPPAPDQEFTPRGEVFDTARKAVLGSQTVWSEFWNTRDVYDEHIKKVQGIAPNAKLENPETDYYVSQDSPRFYADYDAYRRDGGSEGFYDFKRNWNERRFREELGKVAEQNPEKASEIVPEQSFLSRAYQMARKSETSASEAFTGSRQGVLDYGASFADFLASFEPAAELPYLPAVARLDRFWTEAHAARDEAPLAASAVAALDAEQLAGTVLHPHAAARWAWCEAHPAYSIWSRNRDNGDEPAEFDWTHHGTLITRSDSSVQWTALDAAGCAFMDACAAGLTLTDAAAAALTASPDADLMQLMAGLLRAGAFGAMSGN